MVVRMRTQMEKLDLVRDPARVLARVAAEAAAVWALILPLLRIHEGEDREARAAACRKALHAEVDRGIRLAEEIEEALRGRPAAVKFECELVRKKRRRR